MLCRGLGVAMVIFCDLCLVRNFSIDIMPLNAMFIFSGCLLVNFSIFAQYALPVKTGYIYVNFDIRLSKCVPVAIRMDVLCTHMGVLELSAMLFLEVFTHL